MTEPMSAAEAVAAVARKSRASRAREHDVNGRPLEPLTDPTAIPAPEPTPTVGAHVPGIGDVPTSQPPLAEAALLQGDPQLAIALKRAALPRNPANVRPAFR